ncbi:hypothetical protein QRN89_15640 [Streptomyces chengbuensis]|uniref:hypothetical protein n=1 Tax=Streptomyces sp. NPDC019208 TaxID=3154683 RepID=UPI0025B41120|nr:hypothetical protein [Streptomyces sp. HUAS CB01]WJY51117.1 hypothetical protein QRN89_15640 [Streptomyces sp. HUAS CB01]
MATTASSASAVLSLRMDGELLDRLREHAARRGMSVQDYVVRTLVRDDFDERFKAAVDETEKFYGPVPDRPGPCGDPGRSGTGHGTAR